MRILLLTLAMISTAFSADFEKGNEWFKTGDFAKAAEAYERDLAAHGPDAAVFYNLGNARQREKKYGPAILAYERAKALTPRDPDLRANLAMARKAATAFEEAGTNPRLEQAAFFLSLNEWSWLVAGAALILGGISLAFGAVEIRRTWVRRVAVAAAGLAVVLAGIGWAVLHWRSGEMERGVILVENAPVRLSPFKTADPVGTAASGRIVKTGERNGDFRWVELPGADLRGWVADSDVATVYRK